MRALMLFACILGSAALLACDRPSSGQGSSAGPSASALASAVASAAPSAAPAAAPQRPKNPAEQLLTTWNSALDRHDEEALAKLYAPYVRFYGVRKSIAEVRGAKKQAFAKEPDFRQRVRNVLLEKTPTGYVVRFEKLSGADFASNVAARLVLESKDGELLIVEESDAATDKRFKKEPPPAGCYAAATSVLASLPPVEADRRRVARSNPQASPGGVLYSEDPRNVEAAEGYFHSDRFEPRWWIDVVEGELNIRDALTGEAFAISESLRSSVRLACSPPEVDAGAKRK